jgi:hypothetical protein
MTPWHKEQYRLALRHLKKAYRHTTNLTEDMNDRSEPVDQILFNNERRFFLDAFKGFARCNFRIGLR